MRLSRPGIFLSACLLLSAPAATRAQWDLTGSAAAPAGAYNDPSGRFSLPAPAAWKPAKKNDTLLFSWEKSALTVFYQTGATDPSGMLSTYVQKVRGAASGYTQTNPSSLTVAGLNAQSVTFSGTSPQGVKSRGRIVALTNGYDGMAFILTSPADRFDGDNAAFSQALSGLRMGAGNAVAAPAGAPPTAAGTSLLVKLPERAKVRIATTENMKSGDVKKGAEVKYRVVEDVLGPNNELLIAKGTVVYGSVLRSEGRKMFGKPGKLDIGVDSTLAVDGSKVPLRTNEGITERGKNNSGTVAAVSLLVSPVGVFLKGKDVTIKEGTEFTVYVAEDVTVDASKRIPNPVQ